MIGHAPAHTRTEFASAKVVFEGYINNLADALTQSVAMVAPIVSGTGVKTKVLDGMACGLPVIGTPLAFAGLEVRDGAEAYVAENAALC